MQERPPAPAPPVPALPPPAPLDIGGGILKTPPLGHHSPEISTINANLSLADLGLPEGFNIDALADLPASAVAAVTGLPLDGLGVGTLEPPAPADAVAPDGGDVVMTDTAAPVASAAPSVTASMAVQPSASVEPDITMGEAEVKAEPVEAPEAPATSTPAPDAVAADGSSRPASAGPAGSASASGTPAVQTPTVENLAINTPLDGTPAGSVGSGTPAGSAPPAEVKVEADAVAMPDASLDIKPDLAELEKINLELNGGVVDPLPPPPPPMKFASTLEHVDVDLGPLKSVSRNHAKIEYRTDMGQFCLEIFGRNGAWVDDRYYVKGTVVPLQQGSQIQIATRIFSFVLPPSPEGSPPMGTALDVPVDSVAYESLPYPYNLPPDQVGYAEFFGEAGPGPASAANMAARVPAFNAFAATDHYGLGDGRFADPEWVDSWESGNSDDSDDESSADDDEKPKRPVIKLRTKKVDEESDLSSLSSDEEEEKEPEPKPTKPKKKDSVEVKVEATTPKKKVAGKAPAKVKVAGKGYKSPALAMQKPKEEMDVDEEVAPEPKATPTKKKVKEEKKKESKKKKATATASAPASTPASTSTPASATPATTHVPSPRHQYLLQHRPPRNLRRLRLLSPSTWLRRRRLPKLRRKPRLRLPSAPPLRLSQRLQSTLQQLLPRSNSLPNQCDHRRPLQLQRLRLPWPSRLSRSLDRSALQLPVSLVRRHRDPRASLFLRELSRILPVRLLRVCTQAWCVLLCALPTVCLLLEHRAPLVLLALFRLAFALACRSRTRQRRFDLQYDLSRPLRDRRLLSSVPPSKRQMDHPSRTTSRSSRRTPLAPATSCALCLFLRQVLVRVIRPRRFLVSTASCSSDLRRSSPRPRLPRSFTARSSICLEVEERSERCATG